MKPITNKDLDFYLETLIRFAEYHTSLHNSDQVFADITDVVFRNRIILQLAEDGYITAKQSKNYPNRYEIAPPRKEKLFYLNGGYKQLHRDKSNIRLGKWAERIIFLAIGSALPLLIQTIIKQILSP